MDLKELFNQITDAPSQAVLVKLQKKYNDKQVGDFIEKWRASGESSLFDFYCSENNFSEKTKEDLRTKYISEIGVDGTLIESKAEPLDPDNTLTIAGENNQISEDGKGTVLSFEGAEKVEEISDVAGSGTLFHFAGSPSAKAVTQMIKRGLENGGTVLEIMADDGSKEVVPERDMVGFTITLGPDGKVENTKPIEGAETVAGEPAKKGGSEKTIRYSLTKVLERTKDNFKENYEVLEEIARGGMGKIMRTLDKKYGREVAMKVALSKNPDVLERFKLEARVTGQLTHPNIVSAHDVGLDSDGNPFYTMDFIRGENLEKIVKNFRKSKKKSSYDLRSMLGIFLKVCDALDYAHSEGFVNRDLKTENVMVGQHGEVLVVDWGLAKKVGSHRDEMGKKMKQALEHQATDESGNLTMDGTTMGTPMYMPPEQANGELDKIDSRSDVYSLGGILYEILTGEKPVVGDTVINIIRKVIDGEITPPHERVKEKVAPELSATVMEAMAYDRKDRYQTAGELKADVERFLNHEETSVYRYGPLMKGLRWVQRHTAMAASIFGLTAVLAVGSFLGVLYTGAETAAALKGKEAAEASAEANQAKADKADALAEKADALEKEAEAQKKAREAAEGKVEAEKTAREKSEEAQRNLEDKLKVEEAKNARAEANRHIGRGASFYIKEDYLTAREFYQSAVEADRTCPKAYGDLGNTQFQLARRTKDLEERSKLLQSAKTNLEEALRLEQNPEEEDRSGGGFLLGLGDVLFMEEDILGAEEKYSEAIKKFPGFVNAYISRGRLRSNRKRYDEALQDFQEAARRAPDSWEGHYNIGRNHYLRGRFEEAIPHFQTAVGLEDPHLPALYDLADCFVRLKNWARAERTLSMVEDVLPNHKTPQRLERQAVCYANMSVWEKAEHYLSEWETNFPDYNIKQRESIKQVVQQNLPKNK